MKLCILVNAKQICTVQEPSRLSGGMCSSQWTDELRQPSYDRVIRAFDDKSYGYVEERCGKEHEQDRTIIVFLGSKSREIEAEKPSTDSTRAREASKLYDIRRTTPRSLAMGTGITKMMTLSFPTPGDRASSDGWKEKVRNKLDSSSAQYPAGLHRIANTKSRTDGVAVPIDPGAVPTRAPSTIRDRRRGARPKQTKSRRQGAPNAQNRKKRSFDDFVNFVRCTCGNWIR
ncbi:MAG: hypothetical protein Q9163_001559 [Psora crenata]